MDRKYLAKYPVVVYRDRQRAQRVRSISRKPYSRYGFDYVRYEGSVYPVFYDHHAQENYILLECPVPVKHGMYDLAGVA